VERWWNCSRQGSYRYGSHPSSRSRRSSTSYEVTTSPLGTWTSTLPGRPAPPRLLLGGSLSARRTMPSSNTHTPDMVSFSRYRSLLDLVVPGSIECPSRVLYMEKNCLHPGCKPEGLQPGRRWAPRVINCNQRSKSVVHGSRRIRLDAPYSEEAVFGLRLAPRAAST
jgi:hypothetical protein